MISSVPTTCSQFLIPNSPSRVLVFIDSRLEDYSSLAAAVLPGEVAIILDPNRDGIKQITAVLIHQAALLGNITAVHILSHGSSGCLQIGKTNLNAANLQEYEEDFKQWKQSLDGANIFLYGCEVAQGKGAEFVSEISALTGVAVAAATDKIGQGNRWNLDFKTGEISQPLALKPEVRKAYSGVLATVVVTNINDSGAGSLRQAIASAVAGDTITFDPSLANKTIALTSGQLDIKKDLIIDGSAAASLTISGNKSYRIFDVGSVKFTLKNLIAADGKLTGTDEATGAGAAIRGGNSSTLTIENCQFKNNVAGFAGAILTGFKSTNTVTNCTFDSNDGTSANNEQGAGAIATKSGGTLTVKSSTFSNNKGINGGAINNLLGTLTVEDSTFLNNDTATSGSGENTNGYGGAIYTDGANASGTDSKAGAIGGTITLRNSRFEGNKAIGQGGGMFIFLYPPDQLVIDGCTIVNNQVKKSDNGDAFGGGLRIGNGEYTITNTTFATNLSESQGGGLWVGENSPGTIINSTFSGNKAVTADGKNGLGGAMNISTSDPTTLTNTTIANNYAGFMGGAFWGSNETTTTKNSIFANNTAGNGGNNWNIKQQTGGELLDGGNNLQFPGKNPNDATDVNVTEKITIADPKLGPLQNNGGGILTHALLAGSPAIDAGAAVATLTTDSRKVPRSDGKIDIGAVEFSTTLPTPTPTPIPTATPTATPTPIPTATPIPLPTPTPIPLPTPTPPDISCLCDRFPTPDLAIANITPNTLNETINGTNADELLEGGIAGNVINGFEGNDTLLGMGGNDNLYGNNGNDWLFSHEGNDFTDGGSGDDLVFSGKGNDAIAGGDGSDTLCGDLGDDTILGGEGNDVISGNRGNDAIDGGNGNDLIFGGDDADTILGGEGNDNLIGDRGNDTLIGASGNDSLNGSDGDDFLDAGSGSNVILGGSGNDIMKGGDSNDFISGDNGNDTLCGGDSNDLLYGREGDDVIDGCVGDDTLMGGTDNDLLTGGGGDDFLMGGTGDDTLISSTGRDVFVLAAGEGNDRFVDFQKGEDLIGLPGGLTFEQLSISSGPNASDRPTSLIRISSTGQLLATLQGIAPTAIKSSDFIDVRSTANLLLSI